MKAAASAMTEPTERSIPSVPMTRAMPSATITTGAAWISWIRRLLRVRKYGVKAMLTTISRTIAA